MRSIVTGFIALATATGAFAQEQAPAPAPAIIAPMQWEVRPTTADYARLYPSEALDADISAQVRLDCIVQADQSLQCSVASENPPGRGFAQASLEIASIYRAAPDINGTPTEMGRVSIPIRWIPEVVRAQQRR